MTQESQLITILSATLATTLVTTIIAIIAYRKRLKMTNLGPTTLSVAGSTTATLSHPTMSGLLI